MIGSRTDRLLAAIAGALEDQRAVLDGAPHLASVYLLVVCDKATGEPLELICRPEMRRALTRARRGVA